jgi:predicted RNase H-like nuclease (RuvC/YqgF family)
MHPVVLETMNDILNQVEAREWKRVTQQRDVLLRRNKRQSKQIQSMEDQWQVATEKLGQENSDLRNEIKKLKVIGMKSKILPKGWHMVEAEGSLKVSRDLMKVSEEKINLEKENGKLHELIEGLSGVCRDDFEDLESYVDDVNQQIHDDQKEREREIDDLKYEIKTLKLELKAVKDANVMFMKRYEKKVEEEKKIDEVCSRIQCEDTFGHLIGRIPTDK